MGLLVLPGGDGKSSHSGLTYVTRGCWCYLGLLVLPGDDGKSSHSGLITMRISNNSSGYSVYVCACVCVRACVSV